MEEYIKVKDLVDMLEQRLVFQEEHGFYRDAGYTSRFIESIADIPREDVVAKSEYDKLKEQLSQSQSETAKRIFDDIARVMPSRGNWNSQDIELGFEWGLAEARKAINELEKKYKKEN
jgi:hypothetical protein